MYNHCTRLTPSCTSAVEGYIYRNNFFLVDIPHQYSAILAVLLFPEADCLQITALMKMDVKLDLNKLVSWERLAMIIVFLLIARAVQLGAEYICPKWLVGIPISSLYYFVPMFRFPSVEKWPDVNFCLSGLGFTMISIDGVRVYTDMFLI